MKGECAKGQGGLFSFSALACRYVLKIFLCSLKKKKTLKKNQFKSELKRNSLKYWKKRTTILEFLILQGNSQNRNMVYFRMKCSLPSCLTLAINHTTN